MQSAWAAALVLDGFRVLGFLAWLGFIATSRRYAHAQVHPQRVSKATSRLRDCSLLCASLNRP